MPIEPDAIEIRVVACLVEKQRTTPDAYPLSLNSLRLACNQSTNREPVVDYDEQTVSDALRRTALRGWTRLTSGAGSRARKYRHLLGEALSVDESEQALLAVLMLRGPQTPGELKQRTERYDSFADLGAVNEVLERLIERGFVIRHPRRPGQKEERYEQVLGGDDAVELVAAPSVAPEGEEPEARSTLGPLDGPKDDRGRETGPKDDRGAGGGPSVADEAARLDRLEAELLDLKGEIAKLREALGD